MNARYDYFLGYQAFSSHPADADCAARCCAKSQWNATHLGGFVVHSIRTASFQNGNIPTVQARVTDIVNARQPSHMKVVLFHSEKDEKMPLISSPIDGSPMREIERYGVKIDICQTSGGIWLDKGELEKIIMMIREEALQDGAVQNAPRSASYGDDRSYDDQPRSGQYPSKRQKREGVFENLMDIFDF